MIRYKARNGGWWRALVVTAGNGRVVKDMQWSTASRRRWPTQLSSPYLRRSAGEVHAGGKKASDAEAKRAVLESQVSIKAEAHAANLTVVKAAERKTLSGAAAFYIKQKEDAQLPKLQRRRAMCPKSS